MDADANALILQLLIDRERIIQLLRAELARLTAAVDEPPADPAA